jgi:crossover junction endodeoxyribonuclease RuvC
VALLVAAQSDLAVHEYAPARVKRSVGAGGGSGKDAVARMVNVFLGLPRLHPGDAADALAVAICHLNCARTSLASPREGWAAEAKAGIGQRLKPSYRRFEARGE